MKAVVCRSVRYFIEYLASNATFRARAQGRCKLVWLSPALPTRSVRPNRCVATVNKGLIIRHDTGSRSLCSKLVADLLDLRGLRFEGCRKGLNFRLLLCDGIGSK